MERPRGRKLAARIFPGVIFKGESEMRTILAAFAVLALAGAPAAAFAESQGQGQAKKAEAEAHGKAKAKGKEKDRPAENASATRSNKGGETRGKARADQVKDLNQPKKPGG
jgi:hypothetical protein